MKQKTNFLFLVVTAVGLSACSGFSMFKDNANDSAALAPEPQMPMQSGVLTAAEIQTLLSGKSWKWQGPNNSGVTLFASDGTSLVEVTGKGTTTGKWLAKDGQLCESVAPAPFIPNGAPMTCRPISGSNGQYQVGSATFTLAS